jgi:hypothetical protein
MKNIHISEPTDIPTGFCIQGHTTKKNNKESDWTCIYHLCNTPSFLTVCYEIYCEDAAGDLLRIVSTSFEEKAEEADGIHDKMYNIFSVMIAQEIGDVPKTEPASMPTYTFPQIGDSSWVQAQGPSYIGTGTMTDIKWSTDNTPSITYRDFANNSAVMTTSHGNLSSGTSED